MIGKLIVAVVGIMIAKKAAEAKALSKTTPYVQADGLPDTRGVYGTDKGVCRGGYTYRKNPCGGGAEQICVTQYVGYCYPAEVK